MTAAAYETIRYAAADGVAVVTLDRPQVLNAMNEAMRRELTRCFEGLVADEQVRAVVVTGAGERAFSAGADVREFVEPLVPVRFREQRRRLDFRLAMDRCPQPLVAAFNWPGIKERVTVDGVVTVVDSAAVAAGRFADDHARVDAQRAADESLDHESPLDELFEDQLTAADLIVLNKTDLIDEAGLQVVRGEVASRTARKPGMKPAATFAC